MKTLEHYQEQGVKWCMDIESSDGIKSGLLCDEMGLGKTIQMCSLVDRTWNGLQRPTLVMCMLNNIKHWVTEFKEAVNVDVFDPPRNFSGNIPKTIKVVVLPYSVFHKSSPAWIFRVKWGRLIMDEGHVACNPKTKLHQSLTKIDAERRWVLSATPIQNKEREMLAIANGLLGIPGKNIQDILKNHYLRRTRDEDKDTKLPELNALIQVLDFKYEEERMLYDLVQEFYQRRFEDLMALEKRGRSFKAKMMEGIIRLRQTCAHPRLFIEGVMRKVVNAHCSRKRKVIQYSDSDEEESRQELTPEEFDEAFDIEWKTMGDNDAGDDHDQTEPPEITRFKQGIESMKGVPVVDAQSLLNGIDDIPPHDLLRSTKVEWLISDIISHVEIEKIVVFFSFVEELEIVKGALEDAGVSSLVYQGSMTREEKEKAINTFKTTEINVFLMQIKCGGVGINLQVASRVYITCPNYNPCIDMQAVGRVYRKGQTKPVTAIRIMMKGTVEERCLEISEHKIKNIKGALGEENFFFLVGM